MRLSPSSYDFHIIPNIFTEEFEKLSFCLWKQSLRYTSVCLVKLDCIGFGTFRHSSKIFKQISPLTKFGSEVSLRHLPFWMLPSPSKVFNGQNVLCPQNFSTSARKIPLRLRLSELQKMKAGLMYLLMTRYRQRTTDWIVGFSQRDSVRMITYSSRVRWVGERYWFISLDNSFSDSVSVVSSDVSENFVELPSDPPKRCSEKQPMRKYQWLPAAGLI